jgi:hypothetical protein
MLLVVKNNTELMNIVHRKMYLWMDSVLEFWKIVTVVFSYIILKKEGKSKGEARSSLRGRC